MNILQDIKAAVKLTGEVRKARKAGASGFQIKPTYTMKCFTFPPAYYNTIEGCQTHKLGRDTDRAVKAVFKALPYEVQYRLEFTPDEPGGWVDRARFWQMELKPVLPSKMYHEVMSLFIGRYRYCIRMIKEKAASTLANSLHNE